MSAPRRSAASPADRRAHGDRGPFPPRGPEATARSAIRSVCVFCGSSSASPEMLGLAREVGSELAAAGLRVVYGGAQVGLMGAMADAALAGGAAVTGVLPQGLSAREIAHPELGELVLVDDMAQRKIEMARRSDAYLTLPGGLGTLDELFEALTLSQLGFDRKPVLLLNVDGFFDALLEQLDRMERDGFIPAGTADILEVFDELAPAVARLAS